MEDKVDIYLIKKFEKILKEKISLNDEIRHLNIDSIIFFDFIFQVEKDFSIKIDFSELNNIKTLNDFGLLIKSKLNK
ncbi:acyl carrier protein [symbiont of Argiope bruennichi]|uniref:acyl carrier protein n=1 Tax=symbiont of Argiope bruennichi TaxID=2810479 RepID=UPI003DA26FA3